MREGVAADFVTAFGEIPAPVRCYQHPVRLDLPRKPSGDIERATHAIFLEDRCSLADGQKLEHRRR